MYDVIYIDLATTPRMASLRMGKPSKLQDATYDTAGWSLSNKISINASKNKDQSISFQEEGQKVTTTNCHHQQRQRAGANISKLFGGDTFSTHHVDTGRVTDLHRKAGVCSYTSKRHLRTRGASSPGNMACT